ncbi:hypothetical protein PISMIDRAFT_128886 [Pisolithus microcarpus 441]|uniref:CSN8/PSMD8/EIF3K domain-containing protein n=1 Tax=Pisolithus microcarpus 441 TaxID=765257 RepID=A0A0C9ZYG6_9AGAM|nr:hypothetical protein PISMIDRAFT_128886 [Pisolithus microcarpus 441]
MTQGPPTPPPTSTTEIQDQVRDAVLDGSSDRPAERAHSPPLSVPTMDTYQQAFPNIYELAIQRDFSEVVRYSETIDLKNPRSPSRLLLIVPLALSYLILDNPTLAQLAVARLPENSRFHPLTRTLGNLVASASGHQYAQVYAHAEIMCSLTQQPESANDDLANLITNLVTLFVELFRRKTFTLLSRAFSSIETTQAQIYLGLSREQPLTATSGAWQYDSTSDVLYPPGKNNTSLRMNLSAPSCLDIFDSVAGDLIKLESGL